jgi:membrane protease YdiL (CAAX protease family)
MSDYLELSGSLTADTNYIWLAIGIGIAAPVAEDLLFRGIVQGEFRRVMPEWAAVVIQAVLFSAFHMQIVQSSYVLLPGLLLGIAYAWSKSLWIPIAMHILFNLLGSLLPALVQANEGLSSAVVLVEIIFIPIAVVAAVYLHRKTRRAAGRIADRTADRTAE